MKHLFLTLILTVASCHSISANPEEQVPNSGFDWQNYLRNTTVITCIASLLLQGSSPVLGVYKAGTVYRATGKIGASLLGGAKLFSLSASSGYGLMVLSTYTHKINQDNYLYKHDKNDTNRNIYRGPNSYNVKT